MKRLWGRRALKKKKKKEMRCEQVYLKREITGREQMVSSQFSFCLELPVVLKIPVSTQLRASEEKKPVEKVKCCPF